MGRQRSIDRDKVLDTAEEIVATQGAAGLTIDAVAKAMGISKGGVQYCFGSKDALIDAMFDRWGVPTRRCSRRSPATSLRRRPPCGRICWPPTVRIRPPAPRPPG